MALCVGRPRAYVHRLSDLLSVSFRLLSKRYSDFSGLYFTKKHEWLKFDGKVGTVGISEYAAKKLGDIVFVELPEPGVQLKAGDQCGIIESVKAVTEVYSPASGIVLETNSLVEKSTSLVNKSPLEDGWLYKIALSDQLEVQNLMSQENYTNFLESES